MFELKEKNIWIALLCDAFRKQNVSVANRQISKPQISNTRKFPIQRIREAEMIYHTVYTQCLSRTNFLTKINRKQNLSAVSRFKLAGSGCALQLSNELQHNVKTECLSTVTTEQLRSDIARGFS